MPTRQSIIEGQSKRGNFKNRAQTAYIHSFIYPLKIAQNGLFLMGRILII